jgi:aspartyl-tRNA(Asn)/glutamyl-tRNA(Gln) amidotransferase subunit C
LHHIGKRNTHKLLAALINFHLINGPSAQPAMSLVLSDVERIANLSRLELSHDQAQKTLEQLNGIFALVEKMKNVDTTGIEPLSHPIAVIEELALRLREDNATETDHRDDYQQCAPATRDGLYLVPRVLE